MESLVTMEHLRAHVNVRDWKGAIAAAGELLLKSGCIEAEYIQNMIRSVEELGPYIVLAPGFALAHSAPCAAVKKSAVSLITLCDPVSFGSANDPVRVVMCLACTDKTSHIENLSRIAGVLMKKGMIDQIAGCDSEEDIFQLLNA